MNTAQLCAEVAADALATRLRIEALRIVDQADGSAPEQSARAAVDRRMEQLASWATAGFGTHEPTQTRIGYAPPWKPDSPGVFRGGVCWVDLQVPRHLHPLPSHHPAVRPYLERSARSVHNLPGIRPLPAQHLEPFERAYRTARAGRERLPPVFQHATEAHDAARKTLLSATRNRARATGEPVRLIPFARLLLIEADAAEAAWEVLWAWLVAECDPTWWASIPGLGASHRFPPPA